MESDANISDFEGAKYRRMWADVQGYRNFSPGLAAVWVFLKNVVPVNGATLLDIGCGPGRAAAWFARFDPPFDVHMVDIADNCLDDDVADFIGDRLVVGPLWDKTLEVPKCVYGFCCDVMEHIPPEKVDDTLENISRWCDITFFDISNTDESWGDKIDSKLHLTVEDYRWWQEKLQKHGKLLHATDLAGHSIFVLWGKPHVNA